MALVQARQRLNSGGDVVTSSFGKIFGARLGVGWHISEGGTGKTAHDPYTEGFQVGVGLRGKKEAVHKQHAIVAYL